MSAKELIVSPYELADIVFIKAVTNLHPGSGRGGEIVDLPVQKDNLGFPIIYSSSIKGAMKSTFWQLSDDKEVVKALFGPDPGEGEKFSSAIAILDAFTLAFPVRSLEGVYAFATCPLLLKRLSEYYKLARKTFGHIEKLASSLVGKGVCLASQRALQLLTSDALPHKIIINEEIDTKWENGGDAIEKLEEMLGVEHGRVVILSDDDAQMAIDRSLMRVTRTRIEREKKIVARGALWSEEYVPWGTIFATSIFYSKSKKDMKDAQEVKNEFKKLINRTNGFLIVGGDETIGKGIVELIFESESKGG